MVFSSFERVANNLKHEPWAVFAAHARFGSRALTAAHTCANSERDRLGPAPKSCSMPPVSSSSQPKLSELATACSDAAVTTPRVSASAAYAKSRSSSLGAVALGFSAYAAGHWSVRTPALTARSRARALLPCLRGLAAAFPVSMHTAAQPNDRPSATARRGRHVALVQGREALGRAGVSASQARAHATDRTAGFAEQAACASAAAVACPSHACADTAVLCAANAICV